MSIVFSNAKNLPQPIVDAIQTHEMTPAGTYPIRKIFDAPQISVLKKENKISADVSDYIWALLSKAMLRVIADGSRNNRIRNAASTLSKAFADVIDEVEGDLTSDIEENKKYAQAVRDQIIGMDVLIQEHFPAAERYLFDQSFAVRFDKLPYVAFKNTDKEFRGQQDITVYTDIPLYDKELKTLYYVKVCDVTAASSRHSDLRRTWTQEANAQAYILDVNGYPVEKIEAFMIFKDWSRGKLEQWKDYPTSQAMTIPLTLKPKEQMHKFIRARAVQYIRAEMGDVAECTASDRWEEATQYVVVRQSGERNQKPLKVCVTHDEALTWAAMNRRKFHDAYVDTRPGKSVRCESYCPVRHVCEQGLVIRNSRLAMQPESGFGKTNKATQE